MVGSIYQEYLLQVRNAIFQFWGRVYRTGRLSCFICSAALRTILQYNLFIAVDDIVKRAGLIVTFLLYSAEVKECL